MKFGIWILLATLEPTALLAEAPSIFPLGPELQVHLDRQQDQMGPATGLAVDGSAVVAWSGQDQDNHSVRWLDPQGLPWGPEAALIPPPGIGYGAETTVAANAAGAGVSCWQEVSGTCRCRRLDTRGTVAAEAFRCSDNLLGGSDTEIDPRVAMFPQGGFVVVWRLLYVTPDTSYRSAIQGRFFAADGRATSPVFELVRDRRDDGEVAVAALGGEHAVVVWRTHRVDGSDDGLRGQLVETTGELAGDAFEVTGNLAGDPAHARVAADDHHRFVVVWQADGQDSSGHGVFGQLFSGSGARLGPEIQISSEVPSDQLWPDVAMDRLGNFVVAFYSSAEEYALADDLFLRAFASDGIPRGPQIRVNQETRDVQQKPAVALNDAGLVQVAYESRRTAEDSDSSWDILTRRFALACAPDSSTLCLGAEGRFQVRAFWKTPAGQQGAGAALPLTADTGGFYFFSPGNFELLVKVLDACGVNGHFWIFAAGLTDVAVELIVTDTYTGAVEVFENPLGQAFAPLQRLDLLAGCGAERPAAVAAATAAEEKVATSPGLGCSADPAVLCLRGGRFRVEASWRDFLGQTGRASAFPLSEESGLFSFFTPGNLELAVKVLDGCALNNRLWVFAVGLTNVAVEIEVEDTLTGERWRRATSLGETFPPFLDTAAFAGCGTG